MKPKHPDIAFLMFKLDAELAEMNAVQGRISELKDKIWAMMRDNNLSKPAPCILPCGVV